VPAVASALGLTAHAGPAAALGGGDVEGVARGVLEAAGQIPFVKENPAVAGIVLAATAYYLSLRPSVAGSVLDTFLLRPLQALQVTARGVPTRDCMVVGNKIGAGNFGDVNPNP